jgi:hypothetical protein
LKLIFLVITVTAIRPRALPEKVHHLNNTAFMGWALSPKYFKKGVGRRGFFTIFDNLAIVFGLLMKLSSI